MLGLFYLAACTVPSPSDSFSIADQPENTVELTPTVTATLPLPADEDTVPTATSFPTATGTMPPSPTLLPTGTPIIHVVQAADTLSSIAAKFGVSAEGIQRANELDDPNLILPGQELLIPVEDSPPQPEIPTETETAAEQRLSTPVAEITATPTLLPGVTDQPAGNDVPTATAVTGRALLHNGVLCPEETPPVPAGARPIGNSAVCHLPIVSYQLGNGEIPLILVGGMHGGYEWNTITLAYAVLDHLQANPDLIPPSLTIYLVPNANPDGLYMVAKKAGRVDETDILFDTTAGRFNGLKVDLNRNWDCQWSETAVWRNNPISGGSAPFSEPENQALRDFILNIRPTAVLFWHSSARGVYAAGCGEVDPASRALAQVYGDAAGYPVYDSFQHYDITGDASDWLAGQNISSFTVELSTHEQTDWTMNQAGLAALFRHLTAEDQAYE